MAYATVPENTQKMLTIILLLGFHSNTTFAHTNKGYPGKWHFSATGSLEVCLPVSLPTHFLQRMLTAHKVQTFQRSLISKLAFYY